MNNHLVLRIELRSAATFGTGEGLAGLVDREIEHETNGLPFLRGKALKGLLAEECENIVYALPNPDWRVRKEHLFGKGGSSLAERGILHVGDARVPPGLRSRIGQAVQDGTLTSEQVLNSLTGIRRQTSMNERGAPEHSTLRAMRVVIRGVVLEAELSFELPASPQEMALLAACVLSLRHAGTGRNRGRGWLKAEIGDESQTRLLFNQFQAEVL